jgi:hypothetical protein
MIIEYLRYSHENSLSGHKHSLRGAAGFRAFQTGGAIPGQDLAASQFNLPIGGRWKASLQSAPKPRPIRRNFDGALCLEKLISR